MKKLYLALAFAAMLVGCSNEPRPPELVAQDYLMGISEGDENVIYYLKPYAQRTDLSLTDQEKIHAILLPARFATLKKGGLKEVRITHVEPLSSEVVRVSYILVFYKNNQEEAGELTLERNFVESGDEWLIIN